MNKMIEFIISVKDAGSAAVRGFASEIKALTNAAKTGGLEGLVKHLGSVESLSGRCGRALAALGGVAMSLKTIWGALAAVAQALGAALRYVGEGIEDFGKLQIATIRLSRFVGGMEEAKKILSALTDGGYGIDDFFDETEIVQAVIKLRDLSGGALGTAGDIRVLADAAVAANEPISAIAEGVGAVIGKIMAGEDTWGRYAEQLVKSGVISRSTLVEMKNMADAGASSAAIVQKLWDAINTKNSGALDQARDSITGLQKAAADATGDLKRTIGELTQGFAIAWDAIKIGFSRSIGFVVQGLIDLIKFISTMAGSIAGGGTTKDAWNAALDEYQTRHAEGDGRTTKIKGGAASVKASEDGASAGSGGSGGTGGKAEKKTDQLDAKLSDVRDRNAVAGMPPDQEVDFLRKKKDALMDKFTKGEQTEDDILQLQIDQEELTGRINEILRRKAAKEARDLAEYDKEYNENVKKQDRERIIAGAKLAESKQSLQEYRDSKLTPEKQLAIAEKKVSSIEGTLRGPMAVEQRSETIKEYISAMKHRDSLKETVESKSENRIERIQQIKDRLSDLGQPSRASASVGDVFDFKRGSAGKHPLDHHMSEMVKLNKELIKLQKEQAVN